MPSSVDFSGRPFHFIGIGGIGMSALAYVLAKRQLPIYGSDLKSSHITERLQSLGAHIFWQQDATNFDVFQPSSVALSETLSPNIQAKDQTNPGGIGHSTTSEVQSCINRTVNPLENDTLPQVICSTAIHPGNSEYRAALDLGCPIFHRSDLLAALIKEYRSIAVAGTHGKTTTSSMIGFMLLQAGIDPTIIVGGEVQAWDGNARLGHGPFLVAEADESDGSLVNLSAEIGIVTNIELDHPDHYTSLEQVIDTFQTFNHNCQKLIGCIDCPIVKEHLKPAISYSLVTDTGADYVADQIEYGADYTQARIWERGTILGTVRVRLLGSHNLSNTLAAIAVGRLLGLDFSVITEAIADFGGARRRFEKRGEYGGITFVDDYAHHPSELQATLASAKLRKEGVTTDQLAQPIKRVLAIFQPHRYSRTQAFLHEFAQSFHDSDVVIITDIYSAGEKNPGTISGKILTDLIAQSHSQVEYVPTLDELKQVLKNLLHPGDLALFLGAGNLNQIIPEVMAFYQEKDH